MPDYSLEEAREQARRAGAYFAQVLEAQKKGYIAVGRDDGGMFIAARGKNAGQIRELVEAAGFVIELEKPPAVPL